MALLGTIRGWDVLRHPVMIAQGFGLGALLRCTWAVVTGQPHTFLGLACGGERHFRTQTPHDASEP
jgi:hypothetical protein